MKKRTLNISKLNLKKEVISNLNEIKGGSRDYTFTCPGYTFCKPETIDQNTCKC